MKLYGALSQYSAISMFNILLLRQQFY